MKFRTDRGREEYSIETGGERREFRSNFIAAKSRGVGNWIFLKAIFAGELRFVRRAGRNFIYRVPCLACGPEFFDSIEHY